MQPDGPHMAYISVASVQAECFPALAAHGSLGEPRWAPLPASLPGSHQGVKVRGWKHVIMLPQEPVLAPGDC